MYFGLVYKGTSQNCTKIKLPEGTKLQKKNCTRAQNCTKTIFHQGSILHESKKKQKTYIYIYIIITEKKLKDKLI